MTTPRAHHRRPAPDTAANERATWMTGATLALGLAMILGVLGVIAWKGLATFWPGTLVRVTTADGSAFLAERAGTLDKGVPGRERLRVLVGNRDLGQQSYRLLDPAQVVSIEPAPDAVLVERDAWGAFIGLPRAVIEPDGSGGSRRRVIGEDIDLRDAEAMRRAAATRLGDLRRLTSASLPAIEAEATRLRRRAAAIETGRDRTATGLPWLVWLPLVAGGMAGLGVVGRSMAARRRTPAWRVALAAASLAALLLATLERPWAGRDGGPEARSVAVARLERKAEAVDERRDELLGRIEALRAQDARFRLEVEDPSAGRFAPLSLAQPEEPMRLSQAVRIVRGDANAFERAAVYLARWWDYLSRPPGEEPGSGGVWPVILGTVTLTLLLTVGVVPLGVIAALYLREYARQGLLVSVIRVAINNLAGVPSIVYGMFGLGFFCYSVGRYVDGGPGVEAAPRASWWALVVVLAALVGAAGALGSLAASARAGLRRVAGIGAAGLWIAAVAAAGWLIAATPYFGGLFADKLPEQPTFGGRGILWASLTLALLTLPVVIVATEEAIAAVPKSMREGSFGCGASRWQTVRRIVLPAALPGIMTGAILAMARGAGEVAPLMLVGAVNLAPAPPVSADFPFLHGDRTFMHLGFHIYNLGFQSPDAEATESLVWTTTLLLVAIVLVLNLAAVIIRARLRRRAGSVV